MSKQYFSKLYDAKTVVKDDKIKSSMPGFIVITIVKCQVCILDYSLESAPLYRKPSNYHQSNV